MKRVVVIGGGLAGLTAGIFAQKHGYESVIVEKHKITGGQLTGWQRLGHHIDNCIHWLTGSNKNSADYKTWEEIGMIENGELYQSESLYSYEKNGVTLSLYNDLDRLESDMTALSPVDEKAIKDLCFAVRTVQGITGVGGKNHDERLKFFEKIRRVPKLLKYLRSSIGDIAKEFENEVIRGFLSSLMTERFSAIALLIVFATYTGHNGALPKGGSLAAARRITDKYVRLGGRVVCGDGVKSVNVENGSARSVTTESGYELPADAVIVTADPASVFGSILEAEMPKAVKKNYSNKAMFRFSAVQCAFSCDSSALNFKGDRIYDLTDEEKKILKGEYIVFREFTHEPSFAPTGRTVLQSMVFVDERESRRYIDLKENGGYSERKAEIERVVRSVLARTMPKVSDDLVTLDVWTPATYKEYTLTETGSFMSFCFGGGVAPTRASGKIKGLKNVFLATQWQQAPGGLPIAADLGKRAVSYLDKAFAADKRAARRAEKLKYLAVKKTVKQR